MVSEINTTNITSIHQGPGHGNDWLNNAHNLWDDAIWILTTSYIILTMQSGFGLVEVGAINAKHMTNVLVKNVADILFGGISFWMFGYGLAFGLNEPAWRNNGFVGFGRMFVYADVNEMGSVYAHFLFQMASCVTATTLVSGAMAERGKLLSYIVFCFFNTVVFSVQAHWLWDTKGWLRQMGAMDAAGSGVVHLMGAMSSLVATMIVKPRLGRYDKSRDRLELANGTHTMFGLFVLWWGWLGFNCGSTYGVTGGKWKLATRAAANSLIASMGGGTSSVIYSLAITRGQVFNVEMIAYSRIVLWLKWPVLGSLVSISAAVTLCKPLDALIIGAIGGLCVCLALPLLDRVGIDDPVGTFATHGVTGVWGMLATGLFAERTTETERITGGYAGLFITGDWTLLKLQVYACLAIISWTLVTSFLLLFSLNAIMGLRVSVEEEMRGADICEHGLDPRKPARELAEEDFLKSDQIRQRIIDFVNKTSELNKESTVGPSNKLDQRKIENLVSNIAFKRSHTISAKDADAFEFLAEQRKLRRFSIKPSVVVDEHDENAQNEAITKF